MPVAASKPTPKPFRDLLLLFAVPCGVILVAIGFILIPRALAHPRYSFVYAVCGTYACNNSYQVDAAGHLVVVSPSGGDASTMAVLRRYDAATDSFANVTEDEARRYTLLPSSKSPDGYTLKHADGDSGFFFSGSSGGGWVLANGFARRSVTLASTDYGTAALSFIGWIKQ